MKIIMIDRISKIESPDSFTDLCNSIFAEEFFDFQVVDDSGGDAGNDGYSEEEKILFQYYCPRKQLKVTDTKLKTKIKKDLGKTKKLIESEKYDIKKWVFVTPMSLRENVQTFIREEAGKIGLDGISWSEVKLSNLLEKHDFLKSKFPNLSSPDIMKEMKRISTGVESIQEMIKAKDSYSYNSDKEQNPSVETFKFDVSERFLISKINEVHLICRHNNFNFSYYYKNAMEHFRKRMSNDNDWKECVSLNMVKFKEDVDFFSAFEDIDDPEKIKQFEYYKKIINELYKYMQKIKYGHIEGINNKDYSGKFKDLEQILVSLFEKFKLK